MVHLAPTRHGKRKKILTSDHRFMGHVSCIVTTLNVHILDTRTNMQTSTRKKDILLQIPQQETKLLTYKYLSCWIISIGLFCFLQQKPHLYAVATMVSFRGGMFVQGL